MEHPMTVKIADPRKPGDYIIINADVYDPREHTLLEGEEVPDTPLRMERKNKNVGVYYAAGRERAGIQEDTNRGFSTKALGAMTFGATLFGIGVSLTKFDPNLFMFIWIGAMLLVLLIMVPFGVAILNPKKWQYALYLSDLHDALPNYDHDVLLEEVGHGYKSATDHNELVLGKRAFSLQCLIVLGIIEFAGFIGLMTYPFWSHLL